MMDIKHDLADGTTTITMSDGQQVRVPKWLAAPNVIVQDVQNVTTALLALIANLDKRLNAVEGRATAGGAGR